MELTGVEKKDIMSVGKINSNFNSLPQEQKRMFS